MAKKALIIGITGQDGAYLSRLLLEKGYEVYGALRKRLDSSPHNLATLGIADSIKFVPVELLEFTNILYVIKKSMPDEIYNLGAQSSVALSFEQPLFTADVTGMGSLRVIEAIRVLDKPVKFYQASTSEMFGKVRETPQTELTPFYPRSPYAASKLFGYWMAVNFREAYKMFICSGLLFNHESPLRELDFVTRKITYSVARIKHGLQDHIDLGNLEARRDWGYAPEYAEAMWLMMQQSEPDDYVVATGETHSIKEFVETAFSIVGIEIGWEGRGIQEKGIDKASGKVVVKVNPDFFRPTEVDVVRGDYSKAREKLGWSPRTSFRDIVRIMVEHDMKLLD
ncbi:MAG: GDP-mannose 4,6-dehydratase [Nitrospirae bacterium]|nr:GDP-mannose 4,6-dehydratase [Nitrospirota bacterium]